MQTNLSNNIIKATLEKTVVKDYMRYNPQTGAIEYNKPGDVIQVTEKEIQEFSECFETTKTKEITNTKHPKHSKGDE